LIGIGVVKHLLAKQKTTFHGLWEIIDLSFMDSCLQHFLPKGLIKNIYSMGRLKI